MKIAIIGYDLEGKANYDYFAAQGEHQITLCDQKTDISTPDGVATRLGEKYLDGLDEFDLIIRTAGLQPRKILDQNPTVASKITTGTSEFMRLSPSRNIIGITGTKGKGTTSTLTTRMLEAAGKRVHLGGNIGIPALSLLANDIAPDDWVVLELSSFQLIDIKQSPHIAACLMVVPEHLDWHSSLEEYYAAKQNLFRRQTDTDIAVFNPDSEQSVQISSAGQGIRLPYMHAPGAEILGDTISIQGKTICRVDDVKLKGKHNLQNVCAAVTIAWNVTQDTESLLAAITAFTGLEHRLEQVRDVDGVTYYDDSFGTTPETAIVAIQAFDQPKVLILGGSDKGADYAELASTVAAANIRKVLLIGEQAGRLQASLEAAGFINFQPGGHSMEAIVGTAREVAQSGDVVLLSTGCASFGMFKNYKDRGDQFKSVVRSLAATA